MARPRKAYKVNKRRRRGRKTGKIKTSPIWYVAFRDHLGVERTVAGTTDRSTSEDIAKNLAAIVNHKTANQPLPQHLRSFLYNKPSELREQLLSWGIISGETNAAFEPLMTYEEVKAPHSKRMKYNVTCGHLRRWQDSMRERSRKHWKESIARVARVLKGCGFITPADIKSDKFTKWLFDQKRKGKTNSILNGYLLSFKSFCKWMVRENLMLQNPIEYISPYKKESSRYKRRALTVEETNVLFHSTLNSSEHHGMTGSDRLLIYRLALSTGLRYNEIWSLQRRDFKFGKEPTVTAREENTKNSKTAILPLNTQDERLAEDLQIYFARNLAVPTARAFHLWKDRGCAMLKKDLEAAEIEFETEEGRADFHSLRTTFGTMLVLAEVSIPMIQKLMRHADISTTLKFYARISQSDKVQALKRLPKFNVPRLRQVKTGTFDVPKQYT
jgi:site-specific recombinase XerD